MTDRDKIILALCHTGMDGPKEAHMCLGLIRKAILLTSEQVTSVSEVVAAGVKAREQFNRDQS